MLNDATVRCVMHTGLDLRSVRSGATTGPEWR
jgi:hypothetical protein